MPPARRRAARRRACALLCTLALCAACSEPPQKEIDRAQGAIDAARAAGADLYAAEAFTAATVSLQQAHEAVEGRDYRLALSRALDANERALEAAKEAANGKARARSEVEGMLTAAAASLQQLDTKLRAAESARVQPLDRARRLRADSQRALQEARAASKDGQYLPAMAGIKDVPTRVSSEIKALDDAIRSRPARAARRRR